MAVAFDAVGPSSAGAGGAGPPASPITWSHTCTGSDLVLFVGIGVGRQISPDSNIAITAVTYNGVAMTLVPSSLVHCGAATNGYVVLYSLVNPATGANTVSVSFTDTSPSAADALELGSISFTGVNQTTPFQNLASATGTTGSPTVNVTSSAGNMVLDVAGNGNTFTNSNQTQRWLKNVNGSSTCGNAAQSTAAGAASVTMSYVIAADFWAIVGIDIVAVAVGAGDDVLVRYGSMTATDGSGLVMAAFANAAAAGTVGGGYYLWYYQNVVQDEV